MPLYVMVRHVMVCHGSAMSGKPRRGSISHRWARFHFRIVSQWPAILATHLREHSPGTRQLVARCRIARRQAERLFPLRDRLIQPATVFEGIP
jgi:hypothetical protein